MTINEVRPRVGPPFRQTGQELTVTRMTQIEVEVIVEANIPRPYAEKAVSAAIWEHFAKGSLTRDIFLGLGRILEPYHDE